MSPKTRFPPKRGCNAKELSYFEPETEIIEDMQKDEAATQNLTAQEPNACGNTPGSSHNPMHERTHAPALTVEEQLQKMATMMTEQCNEIKLMKTTINDQCNEIKLMKTTINDQRNENEQLKTTVKNAESKIELLKKEVNEIKQTTHNDINIKIERVKAEIKEKLDRQAENIAKNQEKFQSEYRKAIANTENIRQQDKMRFEASTMQTQVIISGHNIPAETEGENTLEIAKDLLTNQLKNSNICQVKNAKRFGRVNANRQRTATRSIVIETASRNEKKDVLHSAFTTKPDGLFFNELLPQEINKLFFRLRGLKKAGHIANLHTRDGVIKVRKTTTGKQYDILTEDDLQAFLTAAGLTERIN